MVYLHTKKGAFVYMKQIDLIYMKQIGDLKEPLKFNVNNHIWIELTTLGKKVYLEHKSSVMKRDADIKVDGLIQFQLWDFIKIFGTFFCMGMANIIVNNNMYFNVEG